MLLVLGAGLQGVLLPVRAHLDGFSDQAVGWLGGAFYAGFVLGCIAAPRLLRRAGHTRVFAVLAVVAAQTFPLHAAMPAVAAWLGLRLVSGFCFAGLSMVVESWINEISVNGERGRSLSFYLVVSAIATVAGQSLVRLTDVTGSTPFLLVCLCISLSLVPTALSVAPAPRPVADVTLRIGRLYRTSPVGLLGCLGVGMANGSFGALAPLFLQARGRSPDDVALFLAAAVLGGACLQWPVGHLSDRIDRRLVLLFGCLGALFVALPLALLPGLSWGALLVLAGAFGATAFPLYALCVAHANDHAAPGGFVETSGGLLLTFGIGAAIGPLVAPAVMAAYAGGLFLFTAAVHLVLGLVIAWRMSRRRRPLPRRALAVAAVKGFPAPPRAADPAALSRSPPRWAVR